ncbi:DUF5047 domain-containing protein [Nakamurella sp.]|uniref:DUF5047 domain-containing protein n=1 Tax=Nakamurella sp. TaxID=1869182 RepID=UPI003B3BBBD9
MIALSDVANSVISRSYTYRCRVESWRGADLLADDIPVEGGAEEVDRTLRVPERVTFTVPRFDRGMSWAPVAADHPLSASGQRLRVQVGVDIGGGQTEWIQRGWFVLAEAVPSGDTVTVTASGLLSLVDEARLVSPYQPTGTLLSTLRGLVEPAVTVVPDLALADRSVPSGINYDEDRLGAVMELLDAWGADAWVTEDGYLTAVPADTVGTPVLALTDGLGGTVIEASGSSTREGAANVVVARGTASDGTQVQGVAYDLLGPTAFGGPFNPLPVPYFFSSPLLTTAAQCRTAAQTILARRRRSTAVELTVTMVPHPGLQAGDVVTVTTADYAGLVCVVEQLRLPYTPDGGAQTLTVRSVA